MDRGEPTDPQQPSADTVRNTTGDAAPVPPSGHASPVPPYQAPADTTGSIWTPPPTSQYDWSQQHVPPAGGYPPPAWAPPTEGYAGAAVPPAKRRTGRVLVAGVAALALIGAGVGIGVAVTPSGTSTPAAAGATANPNSDTRPNQQFPGFGDGVSPGSGSSGSDGTGSGSDGTGSGSDGTGSGSTGTSNSVTSEATDAQSKGVVVIDTVLGYQNAQAAGTGMVISSDGTVLTNNHVVEGSTSIRVTVISTGRTYNATVVGTDASDDVAVIKLTNASGLATVTTDTTSNISEGTSVVAVGNAGGTGSLTAATGTVTATGQSITATDESGANAEQLEGLLQTDAAIEAGDSGGPLYDAQGEVVGINTAAATTRSGATAAGYAIPIADAMTIAQKIVAGQASDTITIGLPAFLGVSLSQQATTATIAGVIADLPAAKAGLAAGDTITAINGTAVASASDLSAAIAKLAPGDTVPLTWTTTAGASQSANVTLVAGPAA